MNLAWETSVEAGAHAKAIREWADDGSDDTRLDWDKNIRLTYVTDALGHETRYYYDIFPRLPPPAWAAIFRLAWLCGYARGADPLAIVEMRPKAASARLIACAADGPVLLVGHGIMNRLIARELRAAGSVAGASAAATGALPALNRLDAHCPLPDTRVRQRPP